MNLDRYLPVTGQLQITCLVCTILNVHTGLKIATEGTYMILTLNILTKLTLVRLSGQCLPNVHRTNAYMDLCLPMKGEVQDFRARAQLNAKI